VKEKNEILGGPFREAAKQCAVACEVPFRYGNGVRQLNGGFALAALGSFAFACYIQIQTIYTISHI
jgi:hypothetical protein